jgi:hypothetical protein
MSYVPTKPTTVLTHPRPRIAEVQCSRLQFEPGDRIIVRVYQPLDKEAKRKLRKTVEKWGGDVEVLIVDCTVFDVDIDKSGGIT